MRAAVYSRYSTDLQNAASIEDQVRLCRERIDQEGWELVHTYIDRKLSGASHLRPGYQKLIEDARKGLFDIVLAEALDRLSRDQEHVAGFYKQLTFAGVKMLTLAEGEISELHVGLKGTMNALFLKDLADKTRRGLRGRVEAGMSGGGLCFGYDIVREFDAMGEPVRGKRRINEKEAAVVRRILESFVAGQSPKAIAKALNAEKIPGPSGNGWTASTIHGNRQRGSGILNNELYVGRMVWNRLRYSKDPQTGRRVSKLNPKSAWITKDLPDLRIIDDALWQRVKTRQIELELPERSQNIRNALNARHRPRHLFSGLLKCGVCGGNYAAMSQNRYGCADHVNRGNCTNSRTITRQTLESRLLAGIKDRLVSSDLIAVFVKSFNEEWNRQVTATTQNKGALQADLADTKRRIDQVIEAIEQGIITPTTKDRLLALEARQQEIQAALAKAEKSPPAPSLHPNLAEIYRHKVADLEMALNDPAAESEAVQALRSLVDAVVLYPGKKRGEVTIELYGELAALTEIVARNGKTGTSCDVPVSLVAGAGYHLYRTRVRFDR